MLKSWRFWIGLAISAISLYFAFQGIQLDQVAAALIGMDYRWLIPATIFFVISYAGRVFRWQLLFSPQHVGWWNTFHFLNIGYFLNNILPARLGDFIRAYLLGNIENVSKARALSTVVVERMIDVLTVVLILAGTALFVPIPEAAQQGAVSVGLVGVLAMALLLVLAFQKERGLAILHRLASPFSVLQRPLLWRALESLIDGLAVVRSPRPILGAWGWSFDAWIFGGFMFWSIMQAVHLPLGIPAAFLVMTVTSLVVVVPSSPGYIGIFHYVATQTLVSIFEIDKNPALSYALVMHAFTFIWLTVLGIYSIWHEGLTYQRIQTVNG